MWEDHRRREEKQNVDSLTRHRDADSFDFPSLEGDERNLKKEIRHGGALLINTEMIGHSGAVPMRRREEVGEQ